MVDATENVARTLRRTILTALAVGVLFAARSSPAVGSPPQEAAFSMCGSSSASDLGSKLAAEFASRNKSKAVNCESCDSGYALTRLEKRECDVALVIQSLAMAGRLDGRFEAFPLGQYVVAVAVNSKNPIRSVGAEQLSSMFEGKTTSWSKIAQAGGSQRVELYSPLLRRTESYVFQSKVMQRRWFAKELRDRTAEPSRQKHFPDEIVGEVIKNPGGIGFFQLAPDMTLDKRVHLLEVAPGKHDTPVGPSIETIAEGAYPITDQLMLYLHPDAPSEAREFCRFTTGSEAAKIVRQFGLWPEYDLEQVRGKQRLAEVRAGEGMEIVTCDLAGGAETLKDLALEFVKTKAVVRLKFQKAATRGEAVEKLANGETELLLTDGPLPEGASRKPEGEHGKEGGAASFQSPRSIELGRMAVAIIVHPENPLESLPLDEVKAIFSGEVRKWPAVRGAAAAMHVFGLKQSSPITQLLKEKLAARKSLTVTAHADSEKVILVVARDPAAIGFVDMSQLSPSEKSVKLVKVLEQASAKSTKDAKDAKDAPRFAADALPEDYPLARTLMLYVSPKAGQVTRGFADFLTPEHCKKIIAQYSMLPPLHAEEGKAAKAARERPPVRLASADEPIPLVLDDPDTPQDQPQAKAKKPVAKAKQQAATPEQPEPAKPASDAKPVAASEPAGEPTQGQPGAPSLSDKETIWVVCGVAGAVVLAIGVGWLSASKRKKPRRYAP